jgi:lipoate---protein ligase
VTDRVGDWVVTEHRGTAGALHARDLPDDGLRRVWLLRPDRPALVLGSTQPDSLADPAANVDLVRRRSGGGAVLLDPESALWVDVVVPRGDPLWDDDVSVSFHWLGRVWRDALATLGLRAQVHEGPYLATPASRLVCFAGLGPGEVTIDGRKVVGLSQRRTRAGARFQCVAYLPGGGAAGVVDLLAEPADAGDRATLTAALRAGTATVAASREDLVQALLAALPR